MLKQRKQKGSKIKYSSLQISEYLLPNKYITSTEDQRLLFLLRNNMYRLTESYSSNKEICICKEIQDLAHIYECKHLNENDWLINYN